MTNGRDKDMTNERRIELQNRLRFWRASLEKLMEAHLALVEGGVKKFRIEDRELTQFDISDLLKEILAAEKKVDELQALLAGYKSRKAFGVIPRDW